MKTEQSSAVLRQSSLNPEHQPSHFACLADSYGAEQALVIEMESGRSRLPCWQMHMPFLGSLSVPGWQARQVIREKQRTCEDTVSSHPSNRDPASPPNILVIHGCTLYAPARYRTDISSQSQYMQQAVTPRSAAHVCDAKTRLAV